VKEESWEVVQILILRDEKDRIVVRPRHSASDGRVAGEDGGKCPDDSPRKLPGKVKSVKSSIQASRKEEVKLSRAIRRTGVK